MSAPGAADVSDADVYEDTFDAPAAPAAGRAGTTLARKPPAAPAHTRKPALRIPGMPSDIYVPEAAMNPTIHAGGPAAGAGRDRSTLIVKRSSRGVAALAPRSTGSPRKGAPDLGLRDLSSYYAKETPEYSRAYLNELAYMEAGKERAKARRALEAEREARLLAKHKAAYLSGGRGSAPAPSSGGESSSGGGGFFDRLEAMEKRLQEGRADAKAAFEYDAQPDKLVCPSCGGVQSWAEVKAKQKRCTKDKCGGALYRPKLLWTEVRGSFLKRWEDGIKKAQANKAKLEAEVLPPFRVTHRRVFDRETGEMVEQPVPVPVWEEVRGEFYARNDEAVARIEARLDLAEKEAKKLAERIKPPAAKEYKFSKPLPPFWERQKAMLESARFQDFETRAAMLSEQ